MKTRLDKLMRMLMPVHKRLLDLERAELEQLQGRALSPLEFFQMLTRDPQFHWLQSVSSFIVEVDTLVDESEEITADKALAIEHRLRKLLMDPLGGPAGAANPLAVRYAHHRATDPELRALHETLIGKLDSLN